MTGIHDLLSSNETDAIEYDPAQRFQFTQQDHGDENEMMMMMMMMPRRPVNQLPSLSVLMQPRAPFPYSSSTGDSNHGRAPQPSQQTPAYYSPPGTAHSHHQHHLPHYAPPSPPPSHSHMWSPASATSSVDSTTDAAFPIRRQTFYMHERSSVSPRAQQTKQFQQQFQQRPPCTCGCDPVSSDDEATLLAAAPRTQLPLHATASSRGQPPTAISPTNKSYTSTTPCASAATTTTATTGKKSRYLREMDRRAILARLDKGEKQSVLAKEYHVSRSSICNLFKHRDEVLSRVNQNPFTKHPKKPRSTVGGPHGSGPGGPGMATKATEKLITCVKAIYSPFTPSAARLCVSMETDLMVDTTGRVHRVTSRAASVLLTILDRPDLTEPEFRRCANQVMLLLIEEALVMIPTLNAVGGSSASRLSPSPLCAITMEQANQHAILDVFHSVEPHCPRGYVQFERSQWHQDVKIKLLDTQLASALYNHNVLLLDVAVTSPPMVAFVIESLLRNGAVEAKITIVAVFVSRQVVELVQSKFPAVRIIATDIESGSGSLVPEHAGSGRTGACTAHVAMAPPRSVLFKHRLDHMYATSSMGM